MSRWQDGRDDESSCGRVEMGGCEGCKVYVRDRELRVW